MWLLQQGDGMCGQVGTAWSSAPAMCVLSALAATIWSKIMLAKLLACTCPSWSLWQPCTSHFPPSSSSSPCHRACFGSHHSHADHRCTLQPTQCAVALLIPWCPAAVCGCRLVPQVLLTLVLLVRASAFSSGPYWAMALLGSCYCHCCNYAAATRLSRVGTAVPAKAHSA
jgi:hypothetical protein